MAKSKTEEVELETTEAEEAAEEQQEVQEEVQEPETVGRFSQFKAESWDKYANKLEDAYSNSSKEALRLKSELEAKQQEFEVISKIVNSNPTLRDEISKSLYDTGYEDPFEDGVTPAAIARAIEPILDKKLDEKLPQHLQSNPALREMAEKKQNEDREIYSQFLNEHPELEMDPGLDKQMEIAFAAQAELAHNRGEKIELRKILDRAWGTLNVGEQKMEPKQSVNAEDAELEGMKQMAAKQEAAMSSPSGSKGTPAGGGKRQLSDAERTIAEQLGLSEEAYLEGKQLSQDARAE